MMTNKEPQKEWQKRDDDERFWNKRGFEGIITDYIRRKVNGRPWEDRFYIYDLMAIEEYCVRGPQTYAEFCSIRHLSKKYPNEHNGIRKELDPQWPSNRAQRNVSEAKKAEELFAKYKESQKEIDQLEEDLMRRSKKAWSELGGSP